MSRKARWVTALLLAVIAVAVLTLALTDAPHGPMTEARERASGFAQTLLQLAEPQPVSATAELKPGEVELCDYGRVSLRDDDEMPATVRADAALALDRAAAELMASGIDRNRALGLKLRMAAAVRPIQNRALQQQPDCLTNANCAARLDDVSAIAAAPWVESMAKLALTTTDANAYGQAFQACSKGDSSKRAASCKLLSPDRWAQLDPHNAAPWLYVANAAHERKDAAAVEQAAYKIATSRVSDIRWGSDYAVMQSHAIAEQPRYTQIAASVDVVGSSVKSPIPNYQSLTSLCARESMNDDNRRRLCSDMGEMFVQRDTSLIGFSVGIALGERAGWDRERIENLRDEREALTSMHAATLGGERLFSCGWFEKFDAWSRDVARHGEMGAARARIKASGRGISELAQDRREQTRQIDAEVNALDESEGVGKAPLAAPPGGRN